MEDLAYNYAYNFGRLIAIVEQIEITLNAQYLNNSEKIERIKEYLGHANEIRAIFDKEKIEAKEY